MVDEGLTLHVLPARGVTVLSDLYPSSRTVFAHASSNNMTYHGGPVQHNPKIYLIFWGSNWTTGNQEYKLLTSFYNGFNGSQWTGTLTQYTDSSGHTNNNAVLSGTWIDTSKVPSRPGSSAVGTEAERGVNHFGFAGTDANYVVAIESGHDPSGFRTQWCAWHSDENESQGTVSFTDLPYQSDAGASCGSGSVNSPGTYDGVTIVGGHEAAEAMNDPQLDAWYDASGNEIADKCAWTDLQNTSFSTGTFPTQPLWSNSAGGCVQ